MGARAKRPLDARESVAEVIKGLLQVLRIHETMLAAILRVAVRTLPNWKEQTNLENLAGKGRRLVALDFVVKEARKEGIPGNQILNLLDDPFQPERDDSGCILNLIIQDKLDAQTFNPLVYKQIRDFKKQNL